MRDIHLCKENLTENLRYFLLFRTLAKFYLIPRMLITSNLIKRLILALLLLSFVWPLPAPVLGVTPLSLPPGFVDEVVVSGLFLPKAMAFTPDGRMLIVERGSASSTDENIASVRVFKNGSLLAQRALTLNVCGNGERGLLGIAVDPNFATNGYVYLYYSRQSSSGSTCGQNSWPGSTGPRNRVSRFTMSGDTISPASEVILIDNIATNVGVHNAGDLHFGADGYLYISVGDSGMTPSPASSTSNLMGKILRILPNAGGGYSTSGNPFDNTGGAVLCGNLTNNGSGPCKEIFAYGFRNPFRFAIKPGTSTPYVADVGGGSTSGWEEVNEVISGGNYGYPTCEGSCATPGLSNPIYAYPHPNPDTGAAIIGGAFYTGTSYPAQYQGGYFFTDYVQGWMKYITYNVGSGTWTVNNFATGSSQTIVGTRASPNGDLYYVVGDSVTVANSEIRRIRYTAGTNQAPFAQINVSPSGDASLSTVYNFSAAGSGDPDGDLPLTYNWSFGDGITATTGLSITTHTYNAPGPFVASLSVTDSDVSPLTSSVVTVTVYPGNNPPTATIALTNTTELTRSLYYATDTWQFGVASASDDTALPANPFKWTVIFHHREHTHPFIGTFTGAGGQFTPNYTEPDTVTWYRVLLTVTDIQGQSTTVYQDVFPALATIAVDTNPAGGLVSVDGQVLTATVAFSRTIGLQAALGVPLVQNIAGSPYLFANWSDSGLAGHNIVVPSAGGTYTANFVPAQQVFLPLIRR